MAAFVSQHDVIVPHPPQGLGIAVDMNAPNFHVKASLAALCREDECDTVFVLRRGECPVCGGRNWLPLSKVTK